MSARPANAPGTSVVSTVNQSAPAVRAANAGRASLGVLAGTAFNFVASRFVIFRVKHVRAK
jgi:hypothetical protein